jgi:hypothetical protein
MNSMLVNTDVAERAAQQRDRKASWAIAVAIVKALLLIAFFVEIHQPKEDLKKEEIQVVLNPEEQLIDPEMEETLQEISEAQEGKGGGIASNAPSNIFQDQTQAIATQENGGNPILSGNSTQNVGVNLNNGASSPFQSDNPFGDGGNGGGGGGGDGPTFGKGTGEEGNGPGDDGDGWGTGNRIRINDPVLPKYNTDVSLKIHLKLTVAGDGSVMNAVCIKSKTTTTDQTIINDVIREVKKQVKYKKDPAGRSDINYLTVKVRAQ